MIRRQSTSATSRRGPGSWHDTQTAAGFFWHRWDVTDTVILLRDMLPLLLMGQLNLVDVADEVGVGNEDDC